MTFRSSLSIAMLLGSAGISLPAWAHSMYQAAILLDFHVATVDAERKLPVERLQAPRSPQLSPQTMEHERAAIADYILGNFSADFPGGAKFRVGLVDPPHFSTIARASYVVAHLRLTPPAGANADLVELHCGVLLDRVRSQVVRVSVHTDWRTSTFANDPQLVGVLRGDNRSVRIDRRQGNWGRGFSSVFQV